MPCQVCRVQEKIFEKVFELRLKLSCKKYSSRSSSRLTASSQAFLFQPQLCFQGRDLQTPPCSYVLRVFLFCFQQKARLQVHCHQNPTGKTSYSQPSCCILQ